MKSFTKYIEETQAKNLSPEELLIHTRHELLAIAKDLNKHGGEDWMVDTTITQALEVDKILDNCYAD